MQNHYEINVSLRGRHFFATAERSCTDLDHAIAVYASIANRFPRADGFEITVTHWQGSGEKLYWGPLAERVREKSS